jgi:transposase
MDNYIGLDAHSKTCTFVVIDKHGEILKECKVNTNERNLKAVLGSIAGTKALVFEETNIAQWLYVMLKDCVDKLIVCHPAYLPKKSGPKNDYRDAIHLAVQLRAGNLTSVFHEDSELMSLRSTVGHYETVVQQAIELKYQLKAIYRSQGIASQSSYFTSRNESKILEIADNDKQKVAKKLFEQLQFLEKMKADYLTEFKSNRSQNTLIANLCSVPGVGPVRGHEIAAYICSGHRFENKHKLWAYAKLVRHRDESDGQVLRKRTPHGRSELKYAFMGCAHRVIISPSDTALKLYYKYLIEEKRLDNKKAKKALARKIAAICLSIMKNGRRYSDELVKQTIKV